MEVRTAPVPFVDSYIGILEALCGAADFRAAAGDLLRGIARITGCEAVGLRVHDRKDDYPYFVHFGFDDSFVEKENYLCHRGDDGHIARDGRGVSVLECMCGLVLRGGTDPRLPFFTGGGSFWTNCTTELLASETKKEFYLETRNTCNQAGYESVALVPLRGGDRIVGLLQANSRRRGRFDGDLIGFLERVGRHAGAAVEAAWRRDELSLMIREMETQRREPEAVMAMEEMASVLAHEVKNPLAGMMLSATRLKKLLAGQNQAEPIVEHLVHSVNTLSETVTRVTQSADGLRLEETRLEINDVLESALHLVAPRAANQDVAVAREMAAGLPAVNADAHFLKRAFLNLLANGLEAMPSGGVLSVATAGTGDGQIEVVIGDTGPGVDVGEVETLFKPFFSRKKHGTGLGLSIVRRIAEAHSGTVTLRPRPGGGTEAVMRISAAGGGGPPARGVNP